MACLDEPTVLAFVGGRVADHELAAIDSHLDSCRSCRELVVAAAQTSLGPEASHREAMEAEVQGRGSGAVQWLAGSAPPGERYVISELIGHGAQGLVYAADDAVLGRRVALKLIRPGASDDDRGARILDEARIVARLAHPNIVCVHDAGTTGDGAIYLAMEHVDGGSLAAWLAATPARAPREVLRACAEAGRGLAAAHAAGVVHRDIKPTNILIGADGRARITDFGLATSTAAATGAIVGTVAYMAPEQLAGQASAASDQFALAVTTWEALTGANPFTGRTVDDRRESIAAGPSPPARALPRPVEAALRRGMAAEPDRRFASVDDLVAALARDRSVRWKWTGGIGLGLGVATTAMIFALSRDPPDPCARLEAELAGTWDADVAATLDAAFAAVPRPFSAAAGAEARRGLDDYARSWIAARTRTCRARGEDAAAAELGRRCLWDRRAALATAARTLVAADPAVVEHAADVVARLPALGPCENVVYLEERIAPPTDPAAAKIVDDVAQLVRDSSNAIAAGKLADARALAARAVAAAATVDHPPTAAIAALALGEAEAIGAEHVDARRDLEAAAAAAQRGHDDVTAATAWTVLVTVVGYSGGQHEDGLRYAGLADATIARIGGDPRLQARLDVSRCAVLHQMARIDEAVAACAAARTARIAAFGADDVSVAGVLVLEARILVEIDPQAATEAAARALAIREARLGPDHPTLIEALFTVGQVATFRGELDRAGPLYDRAEQLARSAYGDDSTVMASIWAERAELEYRRGALDAALTAAERSLAIQDKVLGKNHVDLVFGLVRRGRILEELDRRDEALATQNRALQIAEAGFGPDHPNVMGILEDLARLHAVMGDNALARTEVARALAIAIKTGDQSTIAVANGVTAEILHGAGATAEAVPYYEAAIAAKEAVFGPDGAPLFVTLVNLAIAHIDLGHPDHALPLVQRAIVIEEKSAGLTSLRLLLPLDVLGDVQLARKDKAAARAAWERAVALPDAPAAFADDIAAVRKKLNKLGR